MERKDVLLLSVVVFAAIYYVVRVAVFYEGISGDMPIEEEEQPALVGPYLMGSIAG